ncbi:hypothetical protein SASPL_155285 [Salvia splendens]|uniref:GDSL esterase/lipase n=1 Tax=Salvia splendens TaxID=180675 RepID=A0A8X8W232_SALSN|nr:hypothetical protein SASPL_155285 [Salvia splendens]
MVPFVRIVLDRVSVDPWHSMGEWLRDGRSAMFETEHGSTFWEYAEGNGRLNGLQRRDGERRRVALYGLGARKFGIISVPPVGCCPFSRLIQLNLTATKGCFPPMNDLAQAFHLALDGLLLNISSELPGMKYSLGNTFNMTLDVINTPRNLSLFGSVDTACCGSGGLNAEGPCNQKATLCSDRSSYLFWDMFHPTQEASLLAAQALYFGPTYVSPISFSQLADE